MSKISEADLVLNEDGSIYHLNLKPEHLTDFIIAVGDPGRVHRVSRHFDKMYFEMNKREFITHVGRYKGVKMMVISTGLGTDNVEIVMNELDALANIDLKKREVKAERRKLHFIRVGTTGSIQEDIRLGTHLMTQYAVGLDGLLDFYEFEATDYETTIAQEIQKKTGLQRRPYCVQGSERLIAHFAPLMKAGNTVTCPGFYAPQSRSIRLPIRYKRLVTDLGLFHKEQFWLTNLEMETAGYYALARMLGHEVVSLNAVLANRVRNRFSKDPNRVIDALIKKTLDQTVKLAIQ
jgi:uridine phosphorylase